MKRKPKRRRADLAQSVSGSTTISVRVRRVRRLCVAFDCDVLAAELIVDLVEKVEALQRELDRLRRSD